jgi:hypothetical protein
VLLTYISNRLLSVELDWQLLHYMATLKCEKLETELFVMGKKLNVSNSSSIVIMTMHLDELNVNVGVITRVKGLFL